MNGHACSNTYKNHMVNAYAHYCKFHKIQWERANYIEEPTAIQPPTNTRIESMITAAHGTLSLKLDISYRTGLRPCEVVGEGGLRPRDIHADQHTITARSHKKCNPRPPIKIPETLTARLQTYIIKKDIKPDQPLFKGTSQTYSEHFSNFKKRLAKRLNDPTYQTIKLYHIRHAYVTNLLRKIQNAEIVRQLMGHKRLDTTQVYLHLLNTDNTEYIVEGTTDKERAKQLLQENFTYQLTPTDGTMLFRKPK